METDRTFVVVGRFRDGAPPERVEVVAEFFRDEVAGNGATHRTFYDADGEYVAHFDESMIDAQFLSRSLPEATRAKVHAVPVERT